MSNRSRVFFIFPVFNEEENILTVLKDLESLSSKSLKLSSEIIFLFVNDGSTDKTRDLLNTSQEKRIKVINHKINLGPGAAFSTAFEYLLELGLSPEDYIFTLEGDATSDPIALDRLVQRTTEGDDLILASPYLYGGNFESVNTYRLLISHMATAMVKIFLGLRGLNTLSCFFRLYRGSALLALNMKYPEGIVTSKGFECAVEILFKSVQCKLRISEVPFKVDWKRRKGRSKMKIVKTTISYLLLIWQYNIFFSSK